MKTVLKINLHFGAVSLCFVFQMIKGIIKDKGVVLTALQMVTRSLNFGVRCVALRRVIRRIEKGENKWSENFLLV